MKVIVNGSNGRMGRTLVSLIRSGDPAARGFELACAVDTNNEAAGDYPIYESLGDYTGEAGCIIDFSHHSAAAVLGEYAERRGIPLVVATTGQTDAEKEILKQTSRSIPVFMSANMSLGIAVTARLVRTALTLFPDAEVEIVEAHHDRKLDVPSGTSLILAREVQKLRPDSEIVVGRHENGQRTKNEIGIHSLRYGNVVGDHEVIISAGSQTIRIRHEAHDRALFAEGALTAARFICGREPGLYSMEDVAGYEN